MYARTGKSGFGKQVLQVPEQKAIAFGYSETWASTRKINEKAVDFYLKNGYSVHELYGKYQNSDTSVCFSK